VQQASGDIEAALESYKKANAIEPRASALSNTGMILHWRKDYAGAVAYYEKAIALQPNEPQLYANLADTYLKQGQRAEARANYRRAIDLVTKLLQVNPDDPDNLAARATYEAKLGLRADADRDIRKALSLSKDHGQVLYSQAVVQALAGELDLSCTALTRALQLGASAVEARYADEFVVLKDCPVYKQARQSR
jgi:Flp pilus assembly protein TadD